MDSQADRIHYGEDTRTGVMAKSHGPVILDAGSGRREAKDGRNSTLLWARNERVRPTRHTGLSISSSDVPQSSDAEGLGKDATAGYETARCRRSIFHGTKHCPVARRKASWSSREGAYWQREHASPEPEVLG